MTGQYEVEEPALCHVEIRHLLGKQLKIPLVAVVEPVNPGFVAHAAGISVFGYGDVAHEAVEVLKQGIEHLCRSEGFLDLRATIQKILLLANLVAGEEGEAAPDWSGR